jgi:tetratricopeptide (TPR) repeat protein
MTWVNWIEPGSPGLPATFSGVPMRVHVVLSRLAAGESPQQLLASCPGLKAEHIAAAQAFAANLLEKNQPIFAERIETLESWRHDVEKSLDSERRAELSGYIEKTKAWRSVITLTLAILGIGSALTVGGVLVGTYFLAKGEGDAAIVRMKEHSERAQKNVEERLDEQVQKAVVENHALDRAVESLRASLRNDLNDDLKLHVFNLSSSIETYLELQLMNPVSITAKFADPDLLQDLRYSVRSIVATYRTRFDTNRISDARRIALVDTLRGVVSRSLGHRDQAIKWYEEAQKADPKFVEVYPLLGRAYTEEKRYDAVTQKFDVPGKKKAIDFYRDALKSEEGGQSIEIARWGPEIALLEGNYDLAITRANEQIQAELQENREGDARLFRRLADAMWLKACETSDEGLRQKAAELLLKTTALEPDYLKAINNYLWVVTHSTADELLMQPNALTAEERDSAWLLLHEFEKRPITKEYAAFLSTIGEAYAVLGTTEKHYKVARVKVGQAVDAAHRARRSLSPELGKKQEMDYKSRVAKVDKAIIDRMKATSNP